MRISKILLWTSLLISSLMTCSVFAFTPIATKWVKVFTNKLVNTTPPTWFKPSDTEDVNYRLGVLPSESDKKSDLLIVIPKMWLVAPVNSISDTTDLANITKAMKKNDGKTFNLIFDKYYAQGVNRFPGSSEVGLAGNSILGGHSNFRNVKSGKKYSNSNYSTIFGRLPELDNGDEIRFYKKIANHTWKLLKYTTTKSFETRPSDPAIFKQDKSKKEITLYTCVPIGTAKNRWIVKATLKE